MRSVNAREHTNMITLVERTMVLLFGATLLMMVRVGCNTAHGFGKDVQNAVGGIRNDAQ